MSKKYYNQDKPRYNYWESKENSDVPVIQEPEKTSDAVVYQGEPVNLNYEILDIVDIIKCLSARHVVGWDEQIAAVKTKYPEFSNQNVAKYSQYHGIKRILWKGIYKNID